MSNKQIEHGMKISPSKVKRLLPEGYGLVLVYLNKQWSVHGQIDMDIEKLNVIKNIALKHYEVDKAIIVNNGASMPRQNISFF